MTRSKFTMCVVAMLLCASAVAQADEPKNVILMIADGASWGTWDMASYYEHGQKGLQPYDSFPVKLGMTTYPLNTYTTPQHTGTPQVSYNPTTAWDTTLVGPPPRFAGYLYIKQNYTDSAAAGTAFASGTKTYNSAINYDDFGQPLPFITQLAKARGKATGVVSSVPWSHATPATFGAQNISRDNYAAIASQMINETTLDLIMGGGNPDFDDNGLPRAFPSYAYLGSQTWLDLKAGVAGGARPWTLIQEKSAFDALASDGMPASERLIGVPQIARTLQYERSGDAMGNKIENVPTLATMSAGALNYLLSKGGESGFFAMIEGGAVDWAVTDHNTARAIEEQIDFNHSVAAVVDWILEHGGWDENLLIVTTDHGNAMPMGPNSHLVAFEPITNNGAGNLPGVRWLGFSHTNENALLWANGAGSGLLYQYVEGLDAGLQNVLAFNDGRYIDNTNVFDVVHRVIPEPAPVLSLLLMVAAARRRFAPRS